jgi:hypothetical protein
MSGSSPTSSVAAARPLGQAAWAGLHATATHDTEEPR